MKKSYLLTVIWVFTLLFTGSLITHASDMRLGKTFTAHWASHLPDSTRLCDLSIACAHDAATWDGSTRLSQDQEYDEQDLFEMGVRAFDMRINENGHYRHGDAFPQKDNMKAFWDEQKYHMPNKDQLKGEFMILFFQYEGPDDNSDEIKVKAFNKWLEEGLFNGNNAYDAAMFVRYHKGMTLGDIRGKILVIRSSKNDYLNEKSIDNPDHKIPIALINEEKPWICDSEDCPDYDLNKVPADKKDPFMMSQHYMVKQSEKIQFVEECFNNWFDIYNNDNKNQSGMINLHMLNSYYKGGIVAMQTGYRICSDVRGHKGVNHFTYDFLADHSEPYGIVWCDYLGFFGDFWDQYDSYGNFLLERIIMNNFYSEGKKGKYVSDLLVLMNNTMPIDKNSEVLDSWKNAGWNFTNTVTAGINPSTGILTSSTIIGYKTTDDINQAITDVILTRDDIGNYQDTIVGPCGHKYCKPLISDKFYAQWLNRFDDDRAIYLYYTKDHGTDSVTNKVLTTLEVVDKVCDTDTYVGMWYPESQAVSIWTNINPIFKNDPRYLKYSFHKHEFHLNHDNTYHYYECIPCGLRKDSVQHMFTMAYEQSDKFGWHYHNCTVCGKSEYEQCTALSFDKNGFGTCWHCRNVCTERPQLIISQSSYNNYGICNPGNLYWYALNCCNPGVDYGAQLTTNINITDEIQAMIPWVPIGTSEKATEKYLNEDGTLVTYTDENGDVKPLDEDGNRFGTGFYGTFDGNGHTISINYDGGTKYPACGIFGYINGGTVKNLGIVNSSFKGYDYVGSLAGKIDSATIQNVYISASIANTSNSVYQGGIAGCVGGKTKISNGYYVGDAKLFGEISGEATEVKNFFTSNENDATATYATDGQFANGNVCYLLNDSTYDKNAMWHQNIDACEIVEGGYQPDKYPVLTSSHSMVVPAMYNGKEFINLNMSSTGYSRDDFSVDDNYDYSCPVDFEVKKATQTRDVTGYTLGTVCLPFEINTTDNDGIKLYQVAGFGEENGNPVVKGIEISSLPACTPGIYSKVDKNINTLTFVGSGKVSAAKHKQIFNHDYDSYPQDSWISLRATFARDTIGRGDLLYCNYAFNTATNSFVMIKDDNPAISYPYRGWMVAKGLNNNYHIHIDTTGIDEINADNGIIDVDNLEAPVYDVLGRRVATPFNGQVIICNGKKKIYNNKK